MKKIVFLLALAVFYFSAVPCGWAKLTVGLPNAVKTFKSQMPVEELKIFLGEPARFRDILGERDFHGSIWLMYLAGDLLLATDDINFIMVGNGELSDYSEAPDPMHYMYTISIDLYKDKVYYFNNYIEAIYGKFVVKEISEEPGNTYVKIWYQIGYNMGRDF
ncbi:hypothetical protein KAU32_03490 [bacterium]|nr:hypothetical protein [bacterium]